MSTREPFRFSLLWVASLIVPAFGPLLGSLVLQWSSWRGIFGLLLVWAFIALFALWFSMPESNPKEQRQHHQLSWKILFNNYFTVLRNPIFMRNSLMVCFTFLGMIAWIAAGPFLVITKFQFSTFAFGLFQVMVFGGLILGAQFVNYRISKIGADRLIQQGLRIVMLGGVLAFCLTLLFPHFIWGLILSLMIFTFGSSLIGTPANRIAVEACTVPMGARMAVFSTMMSLSGFIGGLLVGTTYTGTLVWFGILLLLVAIATWWVKGI